MKTQENNLEYTRQSIFNAAPLSGVICNLYLNLALGTLAQASTRVAQRGATVHVIPCFSHESVSGNKVLEDC